MEIFKLISGIWAVRVKEDMKDIFNYTYDIGIDSINSINFDSDAVCYCMELEYISGVRFFEGSFKGYVLLTDRNNKYLILYKTQANKYLEYQYKTPLWGRRKKQFISVFNKKNMNATSNTYSINITEV